jgi:DTW domain-containing protein YfiP
MCAQFRQIPCGIELVVLRHYLEFHRASNTGRLVARSLRPSRLLDYAAPDAPLDCSQLAGEDTWILYPSSSARVPETPPKRIIALDATWPQARKMFQRIPELHGLPSLALPPPSAALPRMRKTKSAEQMSTAEACIAALRLFGEEPAAKHLEATLREAVRRFALPMRKGARS